MPTTQLDPDTTTSSPVLTAATATTHTGHVRARNEDAVGLHAGSTRRLLPLSADPDVEVSGTPLLAVVADGLGGHPCGHLASTIATRSVLTASPRTADELVGAVHAANHDVVAAMSDRDDSWSMGTTLCAALVDADGVTVVNVGDSPAFELVDGELVELTVADTPVGRSAFGSVATVTQTLGGSPRREDVDPHLHESERCGPRRLLLCSDGLTDVVDADRITEALSLPGRAAAVRSLLRLTLDMGAPDNVSVVVVDTC